MRIVIIFWMVGLYLSAYSQDPILCFSDLVSGPNKGNSDVSQQGQVAGKDGTIVTVWGANLGSTQAGNQLYIGQQKARILYWGNATFPADLYSIHRLQKISFQVPSTTQTGLTTVFVSINGVKSNEIPFTIRDGGIYFVDPNGNDVSGDGSWTKPWKTIDNGANTGALGKIVPGDILYIKDGFIHTELVGDRSCFDIGNPGTRAMPKAIIAYPQANVQIGDKNTLKTYSLWVSGYGPSTSWVISGLKLIANTEAVSMYHDFRVVGNFISAPDGNGPTGAVSGQGNDLYLLGNELTNIGNAKTSKLYHPIYIQSAEACSGPRLPLERNREVAFNYLHDNLSYDGINIYRECGSSAYMTDHKIYNNAIINQTGCGIRCGDYVIGENHIYNNLLVDCGLGPDPPNEYAMHVPLLIHSGWDDTTTIIHCYNNTIVGGGFSGGQDWSSSMIGFSQNRPFLLDFRNNIIVSTNDKIKYYNDRFEIPKGSRNNLWFGSGTSPLWDSESWFMNPSFHSTTNFNLTAMSPAIDNATSYIGSNKVLPQFDFLMNRRDDRQDLGAFEYIKSVATNSVQLIDDKYFYKFNNNLFEISEEYLSASSFTEVYNLYGQLVFISKNSTIDMDTSISGIYIFKHFYKNKKMIAKVVVIN